jgi:hypothetical protein
MYSFATTLGIANSVFFHPLANFMDLDPTQRNTGISPPRIAMNWHTALHMNFYVAKSSGQRFV